jgi:hypothetical protein
MNVAFVLSHGNEATETLHFQLAQFQMRVLLDQGHQVWAFVVTDHSEIGTWFPNGVRSIPVRHPDELALSRYWSASHATSDCILAELTRIQQATPLDFALFPAWGALGFSAVRAKRLTAWFHDTRMVTCCLLSHAILEGGAPPSPTEAESILVGELEAYQIRYCDSIFTPSDNIAEAVKRVHGKALTKRMPIPDFSSLLSNSEHSEDQALADRIATLELPETPTMDLTSIKEAWSSFFTKDNNLRRYGSRNANPEVVILSLAPQGQGERNLPPSWVNPLLSLPGVRYQAVTVESPKSSTVKHWLAEVNSPYVLWFDPCVTPDRTWLSSAIQAMERNQDLAWVGAYARSAYVYPLGIPSTLGAFLPCNAPFGAIYRTQALEKIAAWNVLEAPCRHWDLQLALQGQYLTGDLIPDTGLAYQTNSHQDPLPPMALQQILGRHEKLWKPHAPKLLSLMAAQPAILNCQSIAFSPAAGMSWEFHLPSPEAVTGQA